MACLVKESEAHGLSSQGSAPRGLSVWGGEGTAPGFVAPEWALVVIQPKTLIISFGALGLVMGRSNLRVQPRKLGGHPGELVLHLSRETTGERVQLQVACIRPSTFSA